MKFANLSIAYIITISPIAIVAFSTSPCAQNAIELSEIKVDILTDGYPGEISWTLTNNCGIPYTTSSPVYSTESTSFSDKYCLPSGEYTFLIRDTYGDGICCDCGRGSYSVKYEGDIVASGGAFGESDTETFGECAEEESPAPTQAPTQSASPSVAPSVSSGVGYYSSFQWGSITLFLLFMMQ
mmetsp:Transcript_1665/g.3554  ORF Transcript_1665/g.3554 Transcript_1665/m.3554 type:complete len:183 (+) Transcript_1665:64-612(+)